MNAARRIRPLSNDRRGQLRFFKSKVARHTSPVSRAFYANFDFDFDILFYFLMKPFRA